MQGLLDLPVDTSDKGYDKIFFKFHSDKSSCSGRRHQSCEQSVSRNSQETHEPLQDAEGGASKGRYKYSSMFAMCAVTVLLAIFQ
jgi:hypothetical protein